MACVVIGIPGHHTRTDVIMIDALVRRFLGTAGSGLLDFYVQYSLWINALLFSYVVLVMVARRNYGLVAQHILADFLQKHGDKLSRKSPKEIRALSIEMENSMGEREAGWLVPVHLISSRYLIAV